MKRTVIFFVSAILSINLFAGSVTPESARRVAQNVLGITPTKSGSNELVLVWDGSESSDGVTKASTGAKEAAFYVFNRKGGGFAVISGEDRFQPVLGYSYENEFRTDNMPDNLKGWFNGYRSIIDGIRKGELAAVKGSAGAWEAALSPTKAVAAKTVVDLHTALWDQGEPFNQYCPLKNGQRTITGCVATAMAIVMKHYNYPEKGTGTLEGYTTSDGISVSSRTLDNYAAYAWEDMPESAYSSQWTEANGKAVARLIADCGIGVQAWYGINGTSASSSDIPAVMRNHMKYGKCSVRLEKDNYTHRDWTDMLKKELDANRPVLYDGADLSNAGHQFVVDGYDSNGYFKFNWGWSGYDNGFFYITDTEYKTRCGAIIGLMPDPDWKAPSSSVELDLYEYGNISYIESDTPYIEKGKSSTISCCIVNWGESTFSGKIRLVHLNSGKVVKSVLQESSITSLARYYLTQKSFSVKVSSDIEEGDLIGVAYEHDGQWHIIDSGTSRFIPLNYRLASVLSISYDKSRPDSFELKGLKGMTYSYGSANGKFTERTVLLTPLTGTNRLSIDNGHESLSIDVTF